MFAIDGVKLVKLPSNASKQRSGTRADFERQAAKLETAAATMLARHRAADTSASKPDLTAKERMRVARLERDAAEIRDWLARYPEDRRGPKGTVRKSNRTDNDNAKMATGKGVIQGYTGVAAVDSTHQIIVEAQAHGTGAEQELLVPVVTAMQGILASHSLITADAGYHSEANLAQLASMSVDALIADNDMRRRDERFTTQDRHKTAPDPLYDKSKKPPKTTTYQPSDFEYDAETRTCMCPAGKSLYRKGRDLVIKGFVADLLRCGKAVDTSPVGIRDQDHLKQHPRRIRGRPGLVIVKARVERRQINLVGEEMMYGVFKRPGNQLPTQVDRQESRRGIGEVSMNL